MSGLVFTLYCTPHFTLYSTLYNILHTLLCTSHFTLYSTLNTVLNTLHCTKHFTLYSTLKTVLNTLPCTQHLTRLCAAHSSHCAALQPKLYKSAPHSTHCTPPYSTLSIICCARHTLYTGICSYYGAIQCSKLHYTLYRGHVEDTCLVNNKKLRQCICAGPWDVHRKADWPAHSTLQTLHCTLHAAGCPLR